MRRNVTQLIAITAIALGGILYTLIAGNKPLLGLDLQGGVSVRLVATEPADDDLLDQAVEVIRNRVDGLGVAEPEISRTSNGVLVSLPGVDDQQRALELVGKTAEMRFRPVCLTLPATPAEEATFPTTTLPGDDATTTTVSDRDATTTTGSDADAITTTTAASPSTSVSNFAPRQPDTTTTVAPDPEGTTTTTLAPVDVPAADPDSCLGYFTGTVTPEIDETTGITTADNDLAEEFVVLPLLDGDGNVTARYVLGPSRLTGDGVSTARARLNVTWDVTIELRGGEDGLDPFNALAAECFSQSETCSQGQMAITLDGEIVNAASFNTPNFTDTTVVLSRGQVGFEEGEAKDIALSIRYGSLPVPLEAQNTEIVSASIGEDALRSGVIAAIVGFVLVALYLLLYYRLLGLIAILSLLVSSAVLWTIIAWMGENNGLALTLAGVTGLIVSIGVAVDSNIVYYEHLKEDIRDGRRARSSVDRAFPLAFSTIVKADMASLLGAALLYTLTVGAVRGFAFYLGLATVLDLVGSYFFMGPAVRLLAHRRSFAEKPGWYGLPADVERGA